MIKRVPWSENAEVLLEKAIGPEISEVRAQVLSNEAALYQMQDDETDAFFVVRLEEVKRKRRVFISCVAGSGLLSGGRRFIENVRGYADLIQMNTCRKGVAKWAESLGFEFVGMNESHKVYEFYYG